mgnify:FL=1
MHSSGNHRLVYSLNVKQKIVVRSALIGLVISAFSLCSASLIPVHEIVPGGRAVLVAKALLALGLCLAFCIGRMATHRFLSPEDIDGDPQRSDSPKGLELQKILQNTLEQAVLATFAYTTWSVLAPDNWLGVLLIAPALFVVGRILFITRHSQGAVGRAIGFALTFYPTVLLLLVELAMFFGSLQHRLSD